MRWIALAASALVLAAAPALAQQPRAEIEQANARFEQAFNRGDFATVADQYTENATILPPGAQMISGRGAIRDFWRQGYESGLRNLDLQTVSFDQLGDSAGREIGRFTLDAPAQQGGQATKLQGKYVVIWRRGGDGWQLETDIWNLDR